MHKCTKDQQIHINFIYVILMYYRQQHVSARHLAIFSVIPLITRIQP
jgi:hypothetical protein